MAHRLRREEDSEREPLSRKHPAALYTRNVQLLPDDLIDDLSARLSSDWYKLGIELSIETKIIDKLYNRGRVQAERWPLRLLQEWRKTKQHVVLKDQVVELARALEKIHRGDLVYILRSAMGEHKHTELSDKLLLQLAEGVNQDWYTLGIHLDMSADKLDTIRMEQSPDYTLDPGADMLKVYRKQYAGTDMVHDLQHALREIRRLDLARYLDEKLPVAQDMPVSALKPNKPSASATSTSVGDALLSQDSPKAQTSLSSSHQSSLSSHKSHIVPTSVDTSLLAGQTGRSSLVTSRSVYSTEKK